MKTKKIIKILKDIEQVAKFQQKRVINKKALNKEIILEHSLLCIEKEINEIRELK